MYACSHAMLYDGTFEEKSQQMCILVRYTLFMCCINWKVSARQSKAVPDLAGADRFTNTRHGSDRHARNPSSPTSPATQHLDIRNAIVTTYGSLEQTSFGTVSGRTFYFARSSMVRKDPQESCRYAVDCNLGYSLPVNTSLTVETHETACHCCAARPHELMARRL
jgi:hypothetical protein